MCQFLRFYIFPKALEEDAKVFCAETYDKIVDQLKENVEKRLEQPKTTEVVADILQDPIQKLGEQADEIVDILADLGQAPFCDTPSQSEETTPAEEMVEETFVKDEDKYYTVIVAEPGVEQYEQDYDGNSLKESVSNDVTWQLSAIDLICNYKNKAEGFKCEEGFFFYLIDITNDGVPEVFQGPVSDSGKYFEIFSFYYWNGEAYIKGAIDTESKSVHCFLPFKTTSDNSIVFWDHVIPDDYKFHMNNIGYYANSGRIAFDNGRLFYEENIDRSACVDAILDAEQSSEDQADEGQFDEEQATYVDPGFVAYKTEFDSKYYKAQDVHRAYYGYWGDVNSDEEL